MRQQTSTAFDTVVEDMANIRASKSGDYATGHWAMNFIWTAIRAGVSVGTVFRVYDGNKASRDLTLSRAGGGPNNEAHEDTLLDKANYDALMTAFAREFGMEGLERKLTPEYLMPYILAAIRCQHPNEAERLAAGEDDESEEWEVPF